MGATAAVLGFAAVMGAGTGFSASSKKSAGQYNQKVAEQNSQFAEQQAQDALQRGEVDEENHRMRIRQAIGTARASYAAQGVDVNSGSAVDAQGSIAYLGELDAITIRNNAAREAWGYRVNAYNYRAQGRMARYEGNAGATSTVLGGVGNFYKVFGGVG